MNFKIDKQTLDDLQIFGRPNEETVFKKYNQTSTRGGADLLEHMFHYPLVDERAINQRSQIIEWFSRLDVSFPIKVEQLDSLEIYLAMTDPRTKLVNEQQTLAGKFMQLMHADGDQKTIYKGIYAALDMICDLSAFVEEIRLHANDTPYDAHIQAIERLKDDPDIIRISMMGIKSPKMLHEQAVVLDNILRFQKRAVMRELLDQVYQLDVYLSVASVAKRHHYVFPVARAKERHELLITGFFHPLVPNAKSNTIHMYPQKNVVFLTGANMAGKSTLMKSLGIAVYLAHMGFPVAAEKMEFSVQDGLFTTINLPDDLSEGNSHFYAEVLRLKLVAKEVGTGKNLFIIFDELFRGTNVKDAHDGTIAITEAFARRRNCMFVVSTHIMEAGSILKEKYDNIHFVYLPTLMEQNKPIYTYTLEEGITADRHGMIIINNEGILEILRSRKNKSNTI